MNARDDDRLDESHHAGGATTVAPDQKNSWLPLVAALVLVLIIALLGYIFFLRDDAPEEASLDNALAGIVDDEVEEATDADADPATGDSDEPSDEADGENVGETDPATSDPEPSDPDPSDPEPSTPEPSDPASGDPAASETDGAPAGEGAATWTVDTSIGSVEDGTGSFVGFRIDEELTTLGDITAVGRTPDVTGEVSFDGSELTAASFEAQMTSLATDSSLRDGAVQRSLETDTFPTATFTLTSPVDLGTEPSEGAEAMVDAVGDLTVHGVTQTVTIPVEATQAGDVIAVAGSVELALSDYDVEAPSAPVVVSVADEATLEFQLLLTPA